MEKYLIIMLFSINLISFGQNCSFLKDGSYELQYDGKDSTSSLVAIRGNYYYTYENNIKKEGAIKILNNCTFRFENNEKVDESELTEFQKIIAKQKPFFEVTKVEGNVYYFLCRINLHVQCGSGQFIRKEE